MLSTDKSKRFIVDIINKLSNKTILPLDQYDAIEYMCGKLNQTNDGIYTKFNNNDLTQDLCKTWIAENPGKVREMTDKKKLAQFTNIHQEQITLGQIQEILDPHLISDIANIIWQYYAKCEFCDNIRYLERIYLRKEQIEYISSNCHTKLCKKCGISIYHHILISDLYNNHHRDGGIVGYRIIPYLHDTLIDDEKKNGYNEKYELHCPLTQCSCCNYKFVFFDLQTEYLNDDEDSDAIEHHLYKQNCSHCPRCNPLGITYYCEHPGKEISTFE
jgi:hypothetical protein